MPLRVLFIFGTRPEAIKLAPVIRNMKSRRDDFEVLVCVTAQHREMLDQVLKAFEITPDVDLNLMLPGQTLYQSTARIIAALEPVIADAKPAVVLVQGDTTTTFCGALAAFYAKVPVGHVEAGLRTHDIYAPFPEEVNRKLTAGVATWHFAPTENAAENLCREGIPKDSVYVTGNTGIDALLYVKQGLEEGRLSGLNGLPLDPSKKLLVVTAHRRENFGEAMVNICQALRKIAQRDDVQIVFPVHPNPRVRETVNFHLIGLPNVFLVEPMDYVPFVDLMRRAAVILTDSGGIQEEGPSISPTVLVLREKTERPDALAIGAARLIGTQEQRVVDEVHQCLSKPAVGFAEREQRNPFGDGHATNKICDVLCKTELFSQ